MIAIHISVFFPSFPLLKRAGAEIEEELLLLREALDVQSQVFVKHIGKKSKTALNFHKPVPERIRYE